MKKLALMASAVVLFSTTANANSVSIECRDDVERGTLKLTNPPIMNCEDFGLVKKYIGSGVTVGPNSKVNDLVSAIENIKPMVKKTNSESPIYEPLEDEFSGIKRHEAFFDENECPKSETRWINLKFNEDGGVTIKR